MGPPLIADLPMVATRRLQGNPPKRGGCDRRRYAFAIAAYVVKPLGPETWEAYARMVERHNGVFGGCWCTWFHTFHAEKEFSYDANRALKERLVREAEPTPRWSSTATSPSGGASSEARTS